MFATEERDADAPTGLSRLGIGFVQGVLAWLAITAAGRPPWAIAAAHPGLFAGFALAVGFTPMILLAGLGRMRARTLVVWALAATAALIVLGAYDVWRDPPAGGLPVRLWPSAPLIFFSGAAVYIVHHLIEPADVERSLYPSYEGRFETAWRHGFQIALALAFTGVFFGVLLLGAALFDVIGIKVLGELVRQRWFDCPAAGAAFAGGVQLTDVRPGLIRGVRAVALTLLSWLLPLMAGLTAAFLFALIFTGVGPLWATRFAAPQLLGAAAVLIILINAAYQDGVDRERLPAALRWAARGAGLLLTPLTLLAFWATLLRTGQYGLTPERVASLTLAVISAFFAVGYGWAALSRGDWMRPLEKVNVVAALAMLAAFLAVFTPVADPARLSVEDQVGRLMAHKTPPDRFDFDFLRLKSARFGREALAKLMRDPALAAADQRIEAAKAARRPGLIRNDGPPLSHAAVWPAGAALPESFRRQVFPADSAAERGSCLTGGAVCDLYVLDVNGDGKPEVLLRTVGWLAVYGEGEDGTWTRLGNYGGGDCAGVAEALKTGKIVPRAPVLEDLAAGGVRLGFTPAGDCPAASGAP